MSFKYWALKLTLDAFNHFKPQSNILLYPISPSSINKLIETGQLSRMWARWKPSRKTVEECMDTGTKQGLSLNNVLSAFILLGLAMGFVLLLCIVECIFRPSKSRKGTAAKEKDKLDDTLSSVDTTRTTLDMTKYGVGD